jgi:hypothetical protein
MADDISTVRARMVRRIDAGSLVLQIVDGIRRKQSRTLSLASAAC